MDEKEGSVGEQGGLKGTENQLLWDKFWPDTSNPQEAHHVGIPYFVLLHTCSVNE